MKRLIPYTFSPLILLALWEALSRSNAIDVRFFPAPTVILHYLFFVSPSEGILNDITASLYRITWGYTSGAILGAGLGIWMGLSKTVRTLIYPLFAIIYPIPKIAILPLIMLIFGLGDLSKIIVVAIGSFFLVLINTLHGVENIPKIYHDVSFIYKISRWNYFWRVIVPGALPSIFAGLKLAVGYSLVVVVAAEFSGANAGIGYLIWQSWEVFSLKAMYAAIFVIGLLGFCLTLLLEVLERWLIPWRDKK